MHLTHHHNASIGLSQVVKKTNGKAEEKILLNNVCARAKHGEITAIVGPSGAGKSTFLDAIAGRIMASSLEVFFKMFL